MNEHIKCNDGRISGNILKASIYGGHAFKKGKKCFPAADLRLGKLVCKNENNKEDSLYILQAWVDGWSDADYKNLKNRI